MRLKLMVEVGGFPAGTETDHFRGSEAERLVEKGKAIAMADEPVIETAVRPPPVEKAVVRRAAAKPKGRGK